MLGQYNTWYSMKKILVVGDSFSEDMSSDSWVTQLGDSVTNLSNRGISEYKIYQRIKNIDLSQFSFCIINHTSPNRIYIPENPYYVNDSKYQHCDLLYSDIKSREPDEFATNVAWWFENVFDLEQAEFMHNLLIDHIVKSTPSNTLHMTFFSSKNTHLVGLQSIWKKHPGAINHLDKVGNQLVTKSIKEYLSLDIK